MESRRTCPECNLVFEASLPETGLLVCPLCNSTFTPHPPVLPPPPVAPMPRSNLSGRHVLRGVVAVAALVFVAGGLVYAYHLMESLGSKTAAHTEPATSAPLAAASPHPVEVIPGRRGRGASEPRAHAERERQEERRPFSQPSELQPLAIAKEPRPPLMLLEERVNRAIDRGVTYLFAQHLKLNEYRNYLGLLGLTLLECGIAADHSSVRQIAAWIRARERDLKQTYELTLAILFLDRLGDPRDQKLIRAFGQRLLIGQLDCGTWTYSCLLNDPKRYQSPVPLFLPLTNGMPAHNRAGRALHIAYRGDNSNTQFAILGLWVAQRHGVLARSALLRTEQYFRDTQQDDGSWAYHPLAQNWRDSMTCAGLMSLAMRYGVVGGQGHDIRPRQPIHVVDAAVNRGLRYLGQSLDKISVVGDRIIGAEARDPLYFLWSLERMAVIYDLETIGNRAWYPWAAQLLVETQWADGRWSGMGDPVGTCFALLVLKRSNFAKDLQLAVRERPSRPMAGVSGPTILQGPDVFLGQSGKRRSPAVMPGMSGAPPSPPALGPSIIQTPRDKGRP